MERIFRLKSYIVPSIMLILVASVVSYFVTTRWSPSAIPMAPLYFIIVMVVGLAAEIAIMQLATRWAKTENRSFEKTLFVIAGANMINSIFSVTRIPFTNSHKAIGVLLSLLAGIGTWFFAKKIYGINHKETRRLAVRILVIVGSLAVVLGIIGFLLFDSKLRQLGISPR